MVFKSWWNRSPCSSLTASRLWGNHQDDCTGNRVWHACYIQGCEKQITYSLRGFHSCQLFYYQESLLSPPQMKASSPFLVVHLSGKFLIMHKCTNLWSIKNTCRDLLEGQIREHRKYVLEAFIVSVQHLDKLFHQAQLDMEWRKYDLFLTDNWIFDNIWHMAYQLSSCARGILVGQS